MFLKNNHSTLFISVFCYKLIKLNVFLNLWLMKEVFLQYIWANSLFNKKGIRTLSGQKLEIIDIGQLNREIGRAHV